MRKITRCFKRCSVRTTLLGIALFLCGTNSAWATDNGTTIAVEGYTTLHYNLSTDGSNTAEVTYADNSKNYDYTSISVPESFTYNGVTYTVTSIGYCAFSKCSKLTSLTLPKTITHFGDYSLSNCSFTSFTIPSTVTSIGRDVFYQTASLKTIVDNSSATLPKQAFQECTSLTSVTLNDNITELGESVFNTCSALETITLPSHLTTVGINVFQNCTKLKTIVLPSSLTNIGQSMFANTGFTSFTIPNTITSISNTAFSGCTSLQSITIPSTATSLGTGIFSGCTSLTDIQIGSIKSLSSNIFSGCTALTTITLPNTLETINDNAFNGCTKLSTITIPSSVTNISSSAFSGCTSLSSINIAAPSSTLSIGSSSFLGCTALTEITFTEGVSSIGSTAFSGCTNLATITFPSSLKEIGYNAFLNTAWYNNLGSGLIYAGNVAFLYKGTLASNAAITLTAGTISIAPVLFKGQTNLKSITIPDGCLSIVGGAFYGCTNLTSVTMPNSITSIKGGAPRSGGGAFQGCTVLTSITFPYTLTTLEINSFKDCTGLTNIDIPSSITTIRYLVFDGCTNIKKAILRITSAPKGGPQSTTFGTTSNVYLLDDKYEPFLAAAQPTNPEGPTVFYYLSNNNRLYKYFNTPQVETKWGMQTSTSEAKGLMKSGSTTYYYRTACRNSAFIVPEGVTAYKASISSDKKHIVLTEETSTDADGNKVVPANRGVVIRTTSPTTLYDFLETKATVTSSDNTDNVLVGLTATPTTLTANNYLTLGYETTSRKLGFWIHTIANNIASGSAYIPLTSFPAGAKGLSFDYSDNTPDGISSATTDNAQDSKYYYDLQGRIVKNPTKGIYIHNGKKVIY